MGTGGSFPGGQIGAVREVGHISMSGAIPPFPLYAFMAGVGTFFFYSCRRTAKIN